MQENQSRNLVVTVATHLYEGYAHYFDMSCKRHNISPVILGEGEKFEGFGTKLSILQRYVETCNDEDIILMVDRYDLIFLRPLEPLFDFYKEQLKGRNGKPFLYISNEKEEITGVSKLYSYFHWGSYNDRILNSGTYLSTAGLIKRMLASIQQTIPNSNMSVKDDQEMIITYLKENPDVEVVIDDYRRFIVYPKNRIDIGRKLVIEKEQVYFIKEDHSVRPYILHRNGNGKLEEILTKLGYGTDKVIASNHFQRILTHHIPHIYSQVQKRIVSVNS